MKKSGIFPVDATYYTNSIDLSSDGFLLVLDGRRGGWIRF